jgi:outer membrane protein OmpA-like peptidoglycan-associated protein
MDKLDDSYEMLDLGVEVSKKPVQWILLLIVLVGMLSGGAFWWQTHRPTSINTVGPVNNNASTQGTPQPLPTKPPGQPIKGAVLFDEASSIVRNDQMNKLEQFYGAMVGMSGTVNIFGYTDDLGSEQEGLVLSQARAESVAGILRTLSKNDVKYKYNIKSFGESNPIGDNRTESGRAQNRRVELEFIPNL